MKTLPTKKVTARLNAPPPCICGSLTHGSMAIGRRGDEDAGVACPVDCDITGKPGATRDEGGNIDVVADAPVNDGVTARVNFSIGCGVRS